jgi:glutathione S-transferase
MKLYQSHFSPNSRRVRIYLAEKGLEIPFVEVDISKGQSRTPEYLKINPMGQVPALVLDDGTSIAESIAICRYFEALHPEPSLFGSTAKEIAVIEMWQRRIELNWFVPLTEYWLHSAPMYAHSIKQIPELAEQNSMAVRQFLVRLDCELADREYVAGNHYTIADIVALAAMDHANSPYVRLNTDPGLENLTRWHTTVSGRPSAKV